MIRQTATDNHTLGVGFSSQPKQVVLVVLGMHRSGTCVAARVFNLLGALLPGKSLAGDSRADMGHWATDAVIELNNRLLAEGGSGWSDWRPFNPSALLAERYQSYREEIVHIITRDFGTAPIVILNDPRICRLAPLYGEALKETNRHAHYVLPFRNPLFVVASLEKRDKLTRKYSALLWLRYVLEAEIATRGYTRCILDYDAFLSNWRGNVAEIASALSIQWPHSVSDVGLEIDGFLNRDSQYRVFAGPDVEETVDLSPWVKDAYSAMRALVTDPSDAAALEALDRIRGEFDAGAANFGAATIREISIRERRARRLEGHWNIPAKTPTEGNRQLGWVNTGSATGSSRLFHRMAAKSAGMSEAEDGVVDESNGAASLASELEVLDRTARAREEVIVDLKSQLLDLSVDLESSRLELVRILQSRSYRLAQKMQVAYARSSLLRRLANAPIAAKLFGVPPGGWERPTAQVRGVARQRIQASGLFDETFYRQRYAAHIRIPDDLLADFISSDPAEGRDPGPLFSARYYLNANHDVYASGINPLEHFVLYGAREGRVAFSPEKVQYFLSSTDTRAVNSVFDIVPRHSKVTVLYAANGNFFFQDIAEYVAELLIEQGCPARVYTDLPTGIDPATDVVVVVAPHEFFVIGPGRNWTPERVMQVAHVNTEQWQTPWFAKCFHQLTTSLRGVLDINPNSAAGLVKLGAKAAFLPIIPLKGSVFEQKRMPITSALAKLKYIRPLDYPDNVVDRTYDLAYVAVSNPRRDKALAELAGHIAHYRSFIHNPRFNRPIKRDDRDMLGGNDLTQIARNTKIFLNIHRDKVGYLEWHRIFLYGVMNGCVVVTEPCFTNEFIRDGQNYLTASLAEMPSLLKELLETDAGRARLRGISRNNMLLSRSFDVGNRLIR